MIKNSHRTSLVAITLAVGLHPTILYSQPNAKKTSPSEKITYSQSSISYPAGGSWSDTIQLAVAAGWNLVSLPLNVPDGRARVLFPTAISRAFAFHGSYVTQDTMRCGRGYWLKFAAQETISVSGNEDPLDTVSVAKGWNLIGCAARTAVSEIITLPTDIIISDVFGYTSEAGYTKTDTLEPGRAYWVKCSAAGELVLASPGPPGPELISPANRSSDQSTGAVLRWHVLPNAVTYRAQVADDPFFSNVLVDDSTLTDTTKDDCGLPLGSTQYWRVQAKFQGDTVSGWSATWSFGTVVASIIPAPTTLFTYVGGVPGGWYLFNPNTFEKLDSFRVPDGATPAPGFPNVPIEFSLSDSIWYTLLHSSGLAPESLYAIEAYSKRIIRRRESTYGVLMDKDKRYLIQPSIGAVLFIDPNSFSTAVIDSIQFGPLASSPVTETLYGIVSKRVVGIYDIDSFRLIKTISIDSMSFLWYVQDMSVSPDGRNLFLTVWTNVPTLLQGTYWIGTFYHIDLLTDSVVAALPCGKYAQVGVSPDSRFAYLSDAPGVTQDYTPNGKLLRYDAQTRTMEVFIDFGNSPEISNGSPTDEVAVASDNRTIFLTGGGRTCSQPYLDIVKIDAASKNVLGSFRFPLDDQGYRRQQILGFKFGKYNR